MQQTKANYLLPTYFEEFKCIGGACEDTCCAGWRIDIDEATFKKYKKEKNPLMKKALQENTSRNRASNANFFTKGRFKLDENKSCTMLTKEGLCSIQKVLGEEALCHTCTVYPRETISRNDTIEKSLVLSCPEAARIVLNRPDGLDFVEKEAVKDSDIIKNIRHSEEEFESFWKIRIFLIDTLQNRKHSLETRLLILSMFIQKYIDLDNPTSSEIDSLLTQYTTYLTFDDLNTQFDNIPTNYKQQLSFASNVLNHSYSTQFNEMSKIIKDQLQLYPQSLVEDSINSFKTAIDSTYEQFLNQYDFVLENYLVNAVFMQIQTPTKKHLLDEFTKICMDFTMVRLLIIGYLTSKSTLTLEDTLYCIQKYSKSLSHNSNYKNQLKSFLQQDYSSVLSQVTMMVHI